MSNNSENKIRLIIECPVTPEKEEIIKEIATVKYSLPLINSYVIELNETDLPKLKNMNDLKAVHHSTHITAQMYGARKTVKAESAYEKGYTGKNITIAFLDTGIAPVKDFTVPHNRIIAFKDFVNNKTEAYDDNGHGTHVAGIAAGNGYMSNGKYMGIAPDANIVSVKILNNKGNGSSDDVLAGIQWIIDNSKRFNIKIVNLSIGTVSTTINDPLVKAVEALWDRGITITTAAGNNGPSPGSVTSPGISKKVITVGAADDKLIKL